MSDQLQQDLNSTACGASALTDVLERTQQLLAIAMERMDRARNILTNGNPRPECNWGMLDTTDLRSNVEVRGATQLYRGASPRLPGYASDSNERSGT